MSTIYLIRHGQASFGSQNYDHLSPTGFQQAKQLGLYLAEQSIPIQDVVVGGMLRHRQTAENSLEAVSYSKNLILDPNWNEYDHTRILTCYKPEYAKVEAIIQEIGHLPNPMEAFQHIFEQAIRRWVSNEYLEEYTESWEQMIDRTYDGFQNIYSNMSSDQAVLVYTSAGTISALLSKILQLSLEDTLHLQWHMPNCAISTIKLNDGEYSVETVSNIDHFKNCPELITFR